MSQPQPAEPDTPSTGAPDITATTPDLVLGDQRIYFVWNPPLAIAHLRPDGTLSMPTRLPSIPKGMLIHHADPRDASPCVAWLAWAKGDNDPGPTWTLLSLDPLSIAEPFICSRCGAAGGVRESNWWVALA